MPEPVYDLAIIGGGVNGCGVARDASGRGLSVYLCEQGDLASGASSAATKLIHGGLRYLEYGGVSGPPGCSGSASFSMTIWARESCCRRPQRSISGAIRPGRR